MLQSGPKVLTERYDPHACLAQVPEGLQHFVIALAETDHQAALRYGAQPGQTAQRLQTGAVLGFRPDHGGQPLDGFDVVPDDVGLRRDDHLQQFGPGVEIGNKELNGGVGILRPDGTHGFRPMRRTSVGEVVARYRGYDDIPKSHQTDTLGQLGGFRRIGRQRTARSCGAKTAAPCTDIPEDHESRRTAAPAFGFVRTHSAAANRMQRVLFDDVLHIGVRRRAVEPDLQPVGFSQYVCPVIQLRHLSSLFSN